MRSHTPTVESSGWVRRWMPLIPPGAAVLDLACGSGRHTRLLAAHGHPVLAVDRDAQALAAIRDEYGGAEHKIETLLADLEQGPWPLAGRSFSGIVVTNYLHRPGWPDLRACLAADGVLLYETFMEGNARYGKPSNPDFLLRPGELLELAQGMQIVAFEQGVLEGRAVVQRICAIEGNTAPQPLY